MREGNIIYDIINPPNHQPNLFVEEVIKAIDFPLKIPQQNSLVILTDDIQLQNEIGSRLVKSGNIAAFILIVPADKTMLLCSNQHKIYLFESHNHQDKRALLVEVDKIYFKELVAYLRNMIKTDWGKDSFGTNLIPLEQMELQE